MRVRDLLELCFLALLWGSSFLFIRAAVPEFGPIPLVALRLAISAAVLTPVLMAHGGFASMRGSGRALLVHGTLYAALPFTLLAWAAMSMAMASVTARPCAPWNCLPSRNSALNS